MANSINIIQGSGGLGRPLPGEDFISGLLFYSNSLPSGFTSSSLIKEVFSIEDAEALGITDTHIGETKAGGILTASASTVGQVAYIYVGNTLIGSYTATGSITAANTAYQIAASIDAGTNTHGFSTTGATTSSATFSVKAPAGTGVGGNSLTFNNSGTIVVTGSSFTGGVASQIDILHYHIDQFFIAQPKGDLYVGVYAPSTDFAEVSLIQNFSGGKIRQVGAYTQTAFTTNMATALQAQCNTNHVNHKPLEAILGADFSAVSDLTTLIDLKNTLSAKNVSVTIGQDGGNQGLSLWKATGKSIGTLGITLGAVAFASVSNSIAWVSKFNMAGSDYDTLAFANGVLYNALSDGTIDNIDNKGYIFLKKHIGIGGSYFSSPSTCIADTSDYNSIQSNRTINKAERNLRSSLLPALASPVFVNKDGTLTEDTIAYFNSLCVQGLDVMVRDQELSDFSVIINPKQSVISDGNLYITVKLLPVGAANHIIVNLGYVVSIS